MAHYSQINRSVLAWPVTDLRHGRPNTSSATAQSARKPGLVILKLINLPQVDTEIPSLANDDHNPARVKPRTFSTLARHGQTVSISGGKQAVHRLRPRWRIWPNVVALYNLLSPFADTEFSATPQVVAHSATRFCRTDDEFVASRQADRSTKAMSRPTLRCCYSGGPISTNRFGFNEMAVIIRMFDYQSLSLTISEYGMATIARYAP